jgi:hypothetical protein
LLNKSNSSPVLPPFCCPAKIGPQDLFFEKKDWIYVKKISGLRQKRRPTPVLDFLSPAQGAHPDIESPLLDKKMPFFREKTAHYLVPGMNTGQEQYAAPIRWRRRRRRNAILFGAGLLRRLGELLIQRNPILLDRDHLILAFMS